MYSACQIVPVISVPKLTTYSNASLQVYKQQSPKLKILRKGNGLKLKHQILFLIKNYFYKGYVIFYEIQAKKKEIMILSPIS